MACGVAELPWWLRLLLAWQVLGGSGGITGLCFHLPPYVCFLSAVYYFWVSLIFPFQFPERLTVVCVNSAESAVSHLTMEPGSLCAGGVDHQHARLFFIGNSLCLSLLSVAGTKNTDKHILHVQVTVHHVGKSGQELKQTPWRKSPSWLILL